VRWEVIHGDSLEVLRAMPDNSVDAIVTDPPYGLSQADAQASLFDEATK
jgi:DNA modification methylase